MINTGSSAYFASFDAAADLGSFAHGEQFTIAYELRAYAISAIEGNQVFAAVGDPANPVGNPLQVVSQVVPEPGTLVLLGAGALGAGFRRRRRES